MALFDNDTTYHLAVKKRSVHSPPVRACVEPSLGWDGGHSGGRTQGTGFSGNPTPDFSDNTGIPWASPPSLGFKSNKGFCGDRSFPKRTNYAIGFPALVGEWERLASPKPEKKKSSIWKCVPSQSNPKRPDLGTHSPSLEYLNLLLFIVFSGTQSVLIQAHNRTPLVLF